MKTIFGIIGAPGTGKTTLMKHWMENWEWVHHRTGQLDHYVSGDLIVLGVYPDGEVFGGTDKLSMSIAPQVEEFLDNNEDKVILFEGDRLNSKKFFQTVLDKGWNLKIIALDTSDEERERRYEERGSDQDPTWLQGRISKVENVVKQFGTQQTLFGEEAGNVVSFIHNNHTDTMTIAEWIQEDINETILDSVVNDL
jgi:Cdc6-like AAA superfamily ATPase